MFSGAGRGESRRRRDSVFLCLLALLLSFKFQFSKPSRIFFPLTNLEDNPSFSNRGRQWYPVTISLHLLPLSTAQLTFSRSGFAQNPPEEISHWASLMARDFSLGPSDAPCLVESSTAHGVSLFVVVISELSDESSMTKVVNFLTLTLGNSRAAPNDQRLPPNETLAILVEQVLHRYSQTSLTSLRSLMRTGPNPITKHSSVKLMLRTSETSPEPMKKLTAEGFDLILLMTYPGGLGPTFQRQMVGPTHTLSKPIYKIVGPTVFTTRPRSVLLNPLASPLIPLLRHSLEQIPLDDLVHLPWNIIVWFSPQWIRVPLSESSRYPSEEPCLLKISSLNLLHRLKKRLSRFKAPNSHLPAYSFTDSNLQQINVALIQILQTRSIQSRTWPPNLLENLQCSRQVYDPCCTPRAEFLHNLEGPRSANLPSMEILLLQPSSFMERTICPLSSFMENIVPHWPPVFQPRNSPFLTFLLSCAEEVSCLTLMRFEVLDPSSKSKCQSTKTIHHLLDLLVDVASTCHLLACGSGPYRSCLQVLALSSKYLINLSYAIIYALNFVVLRLGWDKPLNFVILLIV